MSNFAEILGAMNTFRIAKGDRVILENALVTVTNVHYYEESGETFIQTDSDWSGFRELERVDGKLVEVISWMKLGGKKAKTYQSEVIRK